ncbi:efhand_like domain-containing protein [Cephalotus follicularis]|uniref:Efhand_like domain-containing protein n=1 Tax=Cephalotus follicularis TaxID=3775 RepID=A0A1Q3DJX2_CEPFO|nr:efhand_like domain-containing protein [Cephalotus follicularis]
MSKQTYKVCFCFQRRFRLAVSEAPDEIKNLFQRYSENGIMTVDHLHRFLIDVQKQDGATREEAQAIIDNTLHELKHLNMFHRRGFHLEAFFKYLFGDNNPPLNPSLGVISSYHLPYCFFS